MPAVKVNTAPRKSRVAIAGVISPSGIIRNHRGSKKRIASTSLGVSRTIEYHHRQILDPLPQWPWQR